MKVNFKNKLVSIFGLHETGKTYFAKKVAQEYDTVVFDVLGEYSEKKFNVWKPENEEYPYIKDEFNDFLKHIRKGKKDGDYNFNMGVCDETSTVLPNKKGMGTIVNNFLNYYRHPLKEKGWNMGFIFMARRPARVNTNIPELSKYIVVFRVTGKNDIRYLNDIASGLGNRASKLTGHKYILVSPDRHYKVCEPI